MPRFRRPKRGILLNCVDLRPAFYDFASMLQLLCKPAPGVDYPMSLEFASFLKRVYPGIPIITGPHPGCHWDLHSIEKAVALARYLHLHGISAGCVNFCDGWGEFLYNGLDGHEDLALDIQSLINDPQFDWRFNHQAYARTLNIGHHFMRLTWQNALRVSSYFLTEEVFPKFGNVLDTFRRDQPLELHFSMEVSQRRRDDIIALMELHNQPVILSAAA